MGVAHSQQGKGMFRALGVQDAFSTKETSYCMVPDQLPSRKVSPENNISSSMVYPAKSGWH